MVRRIAATAGAVALAASVAACGSSGGSSSQPDTEDGLERAATDFAQAIADNDWSEAYTFMNAECQEQLSQSDFEAETTAAVEMAKAFGLDMTDVNITEVQVRDVADGMGEVLVLGDIGGEPMGDDSSWEAWIYEDDSWRVSECGMGDGTEVVESDLADDMDDMDDMDDDGTSSTNDTAS